MKLNWQATFTTEDGNVLTVHDAATGQATEKQVTLQSIAINVLSAFEKDTNATGEQKYIRYEIMKKAKREEDLTVEEVAEIKKCCDIAVTSPWLYGQVTDVLNQKETKLKAVKEGA